MTAVSSGSFYMNATLTNHLGVTVAPHSSAATHDHIVVVNSCCKTTMWYNELPVEASWVITLPSTATSVSLHRQTVECEMALTTAMLSCDMVQKTSQTWSTDLVCILHHNLSVVQDIPILSVVQEVSNLSVVQVIANLSVVQEISNLNVVREISKPECCAGGNQS